MALPVLTPEQHRAAITKSMVARAERAAVQEQMKLGRLTVSEILARAATHPALERMRVKVLLQNLPGVGPRGAAAIMGELGIPTGRRISGLGYKQAAALIERFG